MREVAPPYLPKCIQVDGLGNALMDYEDPNVPSLLSIPLLGYPSYNRTIYANTRARILSHDNKFFFEGPPPTIVPMLCSRCGRPLGSVIPSGDLGPVRTPC